MQVFTKHELACYAHVLGNQSQIIGGRDIASVTRHLTTVACKYTQRSCK